MILPQMTPPQLRAATSNDPLCYVKAGPGSGKTFTAAEAFGYLRLVRYRSDGRGICGVTFARSARRELITRVRQRWGPRVVQWPNAICTFDELHRRIVRFLIQRELIDWPGGIMPERAEDSWATHPDATPQPRSRPRLRLGLDKDGHIDIFETTSQLRAPNPVFVDKTKFGDALASGRCTHTDVRNVLSDAVDIGRHPELNEAIRDCLAGSFCHLVVDEAFDMNPLDIAVVERAIEAGLSITVVGDPWQSLYEFRGSTPKLVTKLIDGHAFRRIDMPGEHRYKTTEMVELARALFDNQPFVVRAAQDGDEFDVVLAHDWGTLWAEDRILMLPAGKANKIDRGLMASSFVLLLNEFVQELFEIEASGVGEARRALPHPNTSELLAPALAALRDPTQSEADVWDLLREAFQPRGGRSWPQPGLTAQKCLARVMAIARDDELPVLGLSVHQAKGLEWERVLFLDGELSSESAQLNVLDIDELSHRNVYVALTRAKSTLRVLYVAPDRYGVQRSAIKRVGPDQGGSVAGHDAQVVDGK